VRLPDSDGKEDPCDGSKPGGGLVVAPKQMSSALGSLMADYGSLTGSDSEDEPQGESVTLSSDCCRPFSRSIVVGISRLITLIKSNCHTS